MCNCSADYRKNWRCLLQDVARMCIESTNWQSSCAITASPAVSEIPRAPSPSRPRFRGRDMKSGDDRARRRRVRARCDERAGSSRSSRSISRIRATSPSAGVSAGRASTAATIGCRRNPLTGMSSGVSAPSTRTSFVARPISSCASRSAACSNVSPGRRRRPAATPGRRAARAFRAHGEHDVRLRTPVPLWSHSGPTPVLLWSYSDSLWSYSGPTPT